MPRVTLIPEMAVRVETKSADVAISHFTAPKPSRTFEMVWRKTNPLTKQFMQIADVVRQSANEI